MTRILITGSRDWEDESVIREALSGVPLGLEPKPSDAGLPTLVHGDCPTGADQIAARIAASYDWHVEAHPADWELHGKAAGPIRNQQMVDAGADVCIAFLMPHSRGTVDCARRAEVAGIPVMRWWGHRGARS